MKRIIASVIVLMIALGFSSCGEGNSAVSINEEDIQAICELSTIKCYYNNVAKIEKEKSYFLQKDRKMWIEYEGEATIGIDMSKLEINIVGDTITIVLPDAEILSIRPIKETLNEKSYIVSEDGFFFKNKITTEDQENAITKGQQEMEQAIQSNSALFAKAESRAKELIENYITNLSSIAKKEYVIVWK